MRESHHPPVADLPRARAQNKRITLLVSVHELAHIVWIARAVAREENVGPHSWQRRRDEIDRALTSVAIAARRSFGHESRVETRHLRRLIRRPVHADDHHKFLRIERGGKLIEHATDARLFVTSGNDNSKPRPEC